MEYGSAKVILSCGGGDFTAGGKHVISEGYKVYENNLCDYFKTKPDTADTYGAFHQTAEALFREQPSFRQRRLTSTQSRMERPERLKPICRQRRRIWRRKLCSWTIWHRSRRSTKRRNWRRRTFWGIWSFRRIRTTGSEGSTGKCRKHVLFENSLFAVVKIYVWDFFSPEKIH